MAPAIRVVMCVVLLAATAIAAHPHSVTAAGDPKLNVAVTHLDTSAFPKASAIVQVGGPVAVQMGDLDQAAVSVIVDGSPVQDFTLHATQTTPVPNATALIIDESGSMRGEAIKAASLAARRFIEGKRPQDSVTIIAFNEGTRTLYPLSTDGPALIRALDALSPGKETALYDAVIAALAPLDKGAAPGTSPHEILSRYVVLLSDGGDTASKESLDEALNHLRASGVQLYAVGLKTSEFDSEPLVRMAEATNGRYVETPDPAALASLYEDLAREIHNQYLIDFTMPSAPVNRSAGEVVVEVRLGEATARASRGFFYPAATATTPGPATLTTAVVETGSEIEESPVLGAFLGWRGSTYVMMILVAGLIFCALFVVTGILFPKRDVLGEYSDILANRRNLDPSAAGAEKPSTVARSVDRLLAIRGYSDPLQRRIEDAGLPFRTSEFVLAHAAIVLVVVVGAAIANLQVWVAVALTLVAVALPLLWLNRKAKKRRQLFESQVPDTLTMMAASLRAGQGFEQALRVVADEGPEPSSQEFRRLLAQQRLGVAPEETLRTLAERMGSEAFDWVVMATIIQRQVGGNLAEIYETIAVTLREREKLRRNIRNLTAEGRLSAVILVALPFFLAVFISIINPEYEALLYTTKAGLTMLGLALCGLVVGVFWIRRIIRLDF